MEQENWLNNISELKTWYDFFKKCTYTHVLGQKKNLTFEWNECEGKEYIIVSRVVWNEKQCIVKLNLTDNSIDDVNVETVEENIGWVHFLECLWKWDLNQDSLKNFLTWFWECFPKLRDKINEQLVKTLGFNE
jgi:hypothetical protein